MLTNGQREVLEAIATFGPLPDHALVPLAQHVMESPQSSSSIRSRRAELSRRGLVVPVRTMTVKRSGRQATVWGASEGTESLV